MNEKINIQLTQDQLEYIKNALHIVARLWNNQPQIAFEQLPYDYDKLQDCVEPKWECDTGHGGEFYPTLSGGDTKSIIEKLKDAFAADYPKDYLLKNKESYWNLYKTFQQYLSVKQNDGYFGWTVDYDGAINGEGMPIIDGDNWKSQIIVIFDEDIIDEIRNGTGNYWGIMRKRYPYNGSKIEVEFYGVSDFGDPYKIEPHEDLKQTQFIKMIVEKPRKAP